MVNIVIPMAGRASRFNGSSYKFPKPLIEVLPEIRMIELVLRYLTPAAQHRFIFICRDEHVKVFKLETLFLSKIEDFVIATTSQITEGPACSALLAEPWINNNDELLIAYCDDYLNIDINHFLEFNRKRNADGGLLLYRSDNPRDSFAVMDADGVILETAEKKVISLYGTAGLYYFKQGKEFVRSAQRMIQRGRRAAGEFFVCPVYNEMIEDGKTVVGHEIPAEANLKMGTPKDLEMFIRRSHLQLIKD